MTFRIRQWRTRNGPISDGTRLGHCARNAGAGRENGGARLFLAAVPHRLHASACRIGAIARPFYSIPASRCSFVRKQQSAVSIVFENIKQGSLALDKTS